MNIGKLKIDHITVLAPLAGITNLPFRLIVKKFGCGLVCTEMVSASGLVYGAAKTKQMLKSCPEEKPLSVQIFGSDPVKMADAAVIVQESGADILDINFGCAVKKILKNHAGAALMRYPSQAEAILKKVRAAVNIPVTIKMRSGWDSTGHQAFKLAEIAQDCGIDAITIHPKTATQGFSGKSDWLLIAELKKRLAVPVIGNGDIRTPDDAMRMLQETNCDAVMIGRAAIGNPWVLSQVQDVFENRLPKSIDLAMRFQTMKEYVKTSTEYLGELYACRMMRSRLGWFAKGLPHSTRFRSAITHLRTCEEAERIIDAYMDQVQNALNFKDVNN